MKKETVYKINSEWDIGHEYYVFGTKEDAREFARRALIDCDFEETLEELEDEGLINYEALEVIGE